MSKNVLLEAAIEAAAEAFHNNCQDTGMLTWENSTEEWRRSIRTFVRPITIAALNAALHADEASNALSALKRRAANN